jgi:hypothetical protein
MICVFVGFSSIFLLGVLIFKGLTARPLYKSFGVKGLTLLFLLLTVIKQERIFRRGETDWRLDDVTNHIGSNLKHHWALGFLALIGNNKTRVGLLFGSYFQAKSRKSISADFIPFRHITSNIDMRTNVSHNKLLLLSSIYATCFGRADHPLAFKNICI